MPLGRRKKINRREWIRAILTAFVIVMVIRSFVAEAFTIPSVSMEKSLLAGDFVIVNKFRYGPRLPKTLLSLPFFHQYVFSSNIPSYLDWIQFPYLRLPGPGNVERNDIVVFNYPGESLHPVDQRTYFIKRCTGLPGDTFEIRDGMVYINSEKMEALPELLFGFHVQSDKNGIDSSQLTSFGITSGGKISDNNDYMLYMTQQAADKLSKEKNIRSVKRSSDKKNSLSSGYFPGDASILWNGDFFGPLYIPKKGDTLRLNKNNFSLYSRLIGVYEKNNVEMRGDSIFINESYVTTYTCKMDYYFMMGDNRSNSTDSRFWGFVPEDHIAGKASFVLFSYDKQKSEMRWDRCFSGVK